MKPHQHGNRELRTTRMLLALLSDDEDNYRQVIREISGCAMCWEAIAHWAIGLVAGSRALAAGGREQAAAYELAELDRVITLMNAPW
jgi:hypothetical protein